MLWGREGGGGEPHTVPGGTRRRVDRYTHTQNRELYGRCWESRNGITRSNLEAQGRLDNFT